MGTQNFKDYFALILFKKKVLIYYFEIENSKFRRRQVRVR